MTATNIIQLHPKCQAKFKSGDDPHRITKMLCTKYCEDLCKLENYPWGKKANPIKYFISSGNAKLSKNQKIIINFLHREYFSRGKACWLKRRNIIKQAKLTNMDKSDLTRTITRLVNRGILLKITGESKKQKECFIIPNIYSYSETENSISYFDTWITETDTRGGVRLCCNYN